MFDPDITPRGPSHASLYRDSPNFAAPDCRGEARYVASLPVRLKSLDRPILFYCAGCRSLIARGPGGKVLWDVTTPEFEVSPILSFSISTPGEAKVR